MNSIKNISMGSLVLKKMKEFKLSIHGSRSLKDERVKIILLEEIEKNNPTTIVTYAEPDGVCKVARDLCKEKAIPLKLHFLNFRFLRGAFEHRSKEAFLDSDFCIFIHDGESKGCSNELILCKKMGLPYRYYKIEKAIYKNSVGFEVEKDWDWNDNDFNNIDTNFERGG